WRLTGAAAGGGCGADEAGGGTRVGRGGGPGGGGGARGGGGGGGGGAGAGGGAGGGWGGAAGWGAAAGGGAGGGGGGAGGGGGGAASWAAWRLRSRVRTWSGSSRPGRPRKSSSSGEPTAVAVPNSPPSYSTRSKCADALRAWKAGSSSGASGVSRSRCASASR